MLGRPYRRPAKRSTEFPCSRSPDPTGLLDFLPDPRRQGGLTRIDDLPFLEFYFNCIHKPSDDPPMLTPRLFALREGDRLYMGLHSHGRYTVETIGRNENVIFAATGTGEAPHNAMVAELLSRGHIGRIAVVTCVRYRDDLGYVSVHRALERRFLNYRYVPLTTREPENVDPSHPSFVGKTYLQDLFASESAVQKIGFPLDPLRTHVYLCGAPAMIGLPKRTPDGDVPLPGADRNGRSAGPPRVSRRRAAQSWHDSLREVLVITRHHCIVTRAATVGGGSKRRRGESVAAVQFGGAHECSPVKRQDGGAALDLTPLLCSARYVK